MPTLPLSLAAQQQLLKRTRSRCPVCHAPCPAEVWKLGDAPAKIFLKRTCPEHGEATACIASDARFYWLAQGKAENSGACCGASRPTPNSQLSTTPGSCCSADGARSGTLGRNADPGDALGVQEKLSTCLALIELVHSCNLACPTCYAGSPVGAGAHVDAVPLADLQRRIQGVIDRKGEIEILQLSGGEPTLHPQFFEFIEWAQAHPRIGYLLLNTNGVRLAQDDAFADRLAKTFRYGKFQLYLQFDGVQEAAQKTLRGADLRALRERALERCHAMNLPVTLAMTVTPENLPHLWDAVEFGLKFPHVRGISFQPMFTSGRIPPSRNAPHASPTARLNTADIILATVEQSLGVLSFDDFTPLPCGDPNCATIGYLLKVGGQVRSVSDFVDFSAVQGFLRDKVRYQLSDLSNCGCESEPLGALLKQFELDETHTFRLFIKPFMDAWSWDEDRIDRCCTHVIRPDGKLDSFCRYYSGFADCKTK
ncbi:MAG: radical SAM protein [Verrucomicrobia bacterium]|nr:radical SAM protein [Verrucomicrobiota bacterium]